MFDSIRDAMSGLSVSVSKSREGKGLLHATAIAIGITEQAVFDGVAYQISTGKITLTSDSTSAILYIQNNSDGPKLNISLLKIQLASSDSSGVAEILIKKNSVSGTIITNALDTDIIQNKNFGKTNTLTSAGAAMVFKGAEGDTINGADYELILTSDSSSILKPTGSIILEPGNSLAIQITPPFGNTSMEVIADAELFIMHES